VVDNIAKLHRRVTLRHKTAKGQGMAICFSGADFWNEAQAAFLSEAVAEDSEWCELVDELDCLLREN